MKALYTAKSTNRKTGNIPQQWVGETRKQSLKSCRGCPLLENKDCYAQYGMSAIAHLGMERSHKVGKEYSLHKALKDRVASARYFRLGAIGDPARLPIKSLAAAVNRIRKTGLGVLGYTHFWRSSPWLKGLLMASCDTVDQAVSAVRQGWRATVYLDKPEGTHGQWNRVKWSLCPYQIKGTQCNRCGLCDASRSELVPIIVFKKH